MKSFSKICRLVPSFLYRINARKISGVRNIDKDIESIALAQAIFISEETNACLDSTVKGLRK